MADNIYDVVVIGGGQSGLAVGYYLRRSGLTYVILDRESNGGGAWQHMWKSLRLFSPAQWSSLPGVIMSGGPDYYPTRNETIEYLRQYENKYQLNVKRPVTVTRVTKSNGHFDIETNSEKFQALAVVNATGVFTNPVIPALPGLDQFKGTILHSSEYVSPEKFKGQTVAVVGEGNSGAQVLAELSTVANAAWVTLKEPQFLPDHVDGRFLFDAATQMYEAKLKGKDYQPPSLGQIVMVPPVKEARERGVFKKHLGAIHEVTSDSLRWNDGTNIKVDAIIFCTGFKPALGYLQSLSVIKSDGKAATAETRSSEIEGMWFVGYGNWTGFASATLIGVGRSARSAVDQISSFVKERKATAVI